MLGRSQTGYAIFEIVAVIALVIVLAVAVVPPLLQSLREQEIARARYEAEAIGQAILAFRRDVGQWPATGDGTYRRGWLVGNGCLGGGRRGLPDLVAEARLSDMRRATLGTMTDHLIRNTGAGQTAGNARGNVSPDDALYEPSSYPHVQPGWNGPYLDTIPLDPWGRPYLVTFRAGEAGAAGKAEAGGLIDSSVVVLSAGPDGLIQTPAEKVHCPEDLSGDDVGYVIVAWR